MAWQYLREDTPDKVGDWSPGGAHSRLQDTVLYSILWVIVGYVLIIADGVSTLGFLLFLVGLVILCLGCLASIYKIGSELIAEEARTRSDVGPRPLRMILPCPSCGALGAEGAGSKRSRHRHERVLTIGSWLQAEARRDSWLRYSGL